MQAVPGFLTPDRLTRLRRANTVVRRLTHMSGFDQAVWQCPVVLMPSETPERPDSVILRPIDSVDGMTAAWSGCPQPVARWLGRS